MSTLYCMKCEGWGCSWCNPRALPERLPAPMTATKARVLQDNEPPDEPISEADARVIMLQVYKVHSNMVKQLDLLRELRLIAMNKVGKNVTKPTRLMHQCAHCARHDSNEKLLEFEGQFYHKHICWRDQPQPFNLK